MTATTPPRKPNRATVIAAIHSMADYFTAHPDIPVPDAITAWGRAITVADEVDEKLRVAGLLTWAAEQGASLFESTAAISATIPLATRLEHSVRIDYVRNVHLDERAPKRYVP